MSQSIPNICNFSPHIQFLAQFFSTQNRVNCDKTNFAKNSANHRKTDSTRENRVTFRFLHICHVEKCKIPSNFGNISHFSTSGNLGFPGKSEIPLDVEIFRFSTSVMYWNLKCLHISHVLKSKMSPHDRLFLHRYVELQDQWNGPYFFS